MSKLLTEQDFVEAAKLLKVPVAAVKAVSLVESAGSGFNSDGSPKILFEGHQFYKYTKGAFASTHPTLCYPKWTKVYYCADNLQEHLRLQRACTLNRTAALMSTSWGKFQIMGFNFGLCGFNSIQSFVNAMYKNEGAHLQAFCEYVKATTLDDELRNQDWHTFARAYNGPAYMKNDYAGKLARAYKKFGGV